MKKVYVSSTYKDLIDYRRAAYAALRKMRFDVISMEDYVAKDQRTVARCQADVAACDLYVGIFAWRYGFIPEEDNPDNKSITELEYRTAREEGKTCLIFLLDKNVAWKPELMDSFTGENEAGRRIEEFRTDLNTQSPSLFKSPDDLAVQLTAAVFQAEATKRVERIALFNDIKTLDLGPSGLPNIKEKILAAKTADLAEINLGVGESWWSTRLHLVAALATDYTGIRQLVFTDQDGRFIGIYPGAEVRRALAVVFPKVEIAYLQSVPPPGGQGIDPVAEVSQIVANFGEQMYQLSDGQGEAAIKKWVTEDNLKRWMARGQNADKVELTGQPKMLLQHQIVNCRSPFVALVENDRLEQVVDRVAVVTNIARTVVEDSL